MFEEMMKMLRTAEDVLYNIFHDYAWGYGDEPTRADRENVPLVEAMIALWERQHEEYIAREEAQKAEDAYYERLENALIATGRKVRR